MTLRPWLVAVVACAAPATGVIRAEAPAPVNARATVDMLRAGGCGGLAPAAAAVPADPVLDRAAQLWAAGRPLAEAAARSGAGVARLDGLHVTGPRDALVAQLRASSCAALMNPRARGLGVYQRGSDTWLIVASTGDGAVSRDAVSHSPGTAAAPMTAPGSAAARSATRPPPADATGHLDGRALQLVNDARARGARCGARTFAPAPPLALSATLDSVAYGHASDMATHGYFEHQDRSGQSPADRVRAAGYREKLVGENIAYGPESIDEAVNGWLASPGHCENLMDPRFVEMGIALAPGHSTRHGLYWVQLLAEPRA